MLANYSYNAWGEILSVTNANGAAITSSTHIANLNPLRYRGYYYDTETGFYYLQSRYYDPVTHRFINADSLASTGQGIAGTNMFSYCGNCPVTRVDSMGNFWEDIEEWYEGLCEKIEKICKNIEEDVENYEENNQDVETVYRSHYFSSYKGSLVIRIDSEFLTSAGIFHTIFLNHKYDKYGDEDKENILNHEYGHNLQEEEMGTLGFIIKVAIPSVAYNLFSRDNEELSACYNSMPWEYGADKLGGATHSYEDWAETLYEQYFAFWEWFT